MAALVDTNRSCEQRTAFAQQICDLRPCCLERFFAEPVVACIKMEGGSSSILAEPLVTQLQMAFRSKVSNVEIELNFARAACSRAAMRGRSHNIPSLVSKHCTAEIKLGQKRQLINDSAVTNDKKSDGPGAGSFKTKTSEYVNHEL